MTLAAAIDLGTTRIKAARLREDGALTETISTPAPSLEGENLVRESDPERYLESAEEVLARALAGAGRPLPVGLASQRSSFLFWEKSSGRPLTPLISWQDRRARTWCEKRREQAARITERTGLPLSPHYAGPKAAVLLEEDASLARAASAGKALFGTPDTWTAWNMTGRRAHITDRSMAARTLLAGLGDEVWTEDLLSFFNLPRAMLPEIVPTWGRRDALSGGGFLTASAADQSAALFALPQANGRPVLVNLGTGGFVLVPTGSTPEGKEGYLSGPAAAVPGKTLYFSEGTVNGIATALEGLQPPPALTENDSSPDLFCIPDTAGIGAPFWKSGAGPLFSSPREGLTQKELGRVVREGIIFRVCGIIEGLRPAGEPGACVLTGGLSADIFLAEGISSALERPCFRLREKEATLLGAAVLATGNRAPTTSLQQLPPRQNYLREKFSGWKAWAAGALT